MSHVDLVRGALARLADLGYTRAPSATVAAYVADGLLDHVQINRLGRRVRRLDLEAQSAAADYHDGQWTIWREAP